MKRISAAKEKNKHAEQEAEAPGEEPSGKAIAVAGVKDRETGEIRASRS